MGHHALGFFRLSLSSTVDISIRVSDCFAGYESSDVRIQPPELLSGPTPSRWDTAVGPAALLQSRD
jgi:hypothetical protein